MATGLCAVAAALAGCELASSRISAPEQALRVTLPDPAGGLGGRDSIGTPDLAVASEVLARSWSISTEEITPDNCAVAEGGVTPGVRRLLRFSVTIPNIGDADLYIGDARKHIDPNGDGDYSDSDGLFEFAQCHAHFHFRNYATYQLIPVRADGSLGPAIRDRKAGFCMIDTTPYTKTEHAGQKVYFRCGSQTQPSNQGISVGYADTYDRSLTGQYFVLDDPAEPAPPGEYLIRVDVNPGFTPAAGEPCPVRNPATGLCHNFAEARYDNNRGEVRITIHDRDGKTGTPIKQATDGMDKEAAANQSPELYGPAS